MKKILCTLLLLVSVAQLHQLWASHIVGGELSYRCLGNQSYRFTLAIYTECGSSVILEESFLVRYFSASQGMSPNAPRSFNVSKQGEEEVSLSCEDVVTTCRGGSFRGVKRVIYEGNVDLNAFDRAEDWVFSWQKPARSEVITTLLFPENEDYYTQITMNNVAAECNNSPVFRSNPVYSTCLNKLNTHSNIVEDEEGDQLVFKLSTPRNSFAQEVTYRDGYDFQRFLSVNTPIVINPVTGDLLMQPILQETGITDILVEEYREGVLISSMTRGIQVSAVDCSNDIPEISDFFNSKSSSIEVCAGVTIRDTIRAMGEGGELLNMSLVSGDPRYVKIVGKDTTEVVAYFDWDTDKGDVGTHLFSFSAEDDVCPEPGIAAKTFIVTVKDTPEITSFEGTIMGKYYLSCNDASVTLSPEVSGGDGNYTFEWPTGITDRQLQVDSTGSYKVRITDGKGCGTFDSVRVSPGIATALAPFNYCFGDTTVFYDFSTAFGDSDRIALRSFDFGDGTTLATTLDSVVHIYASPGAYTVKMTVTDDSSPACQDIHERTITICDGIKDPSFEFLLACATDTTFMTITDQEDSVCALNRVIIDFGDGTTDTLGIDSVLKVPHVYVLGGEYEVTLGLLSKSGCEKTVTDSVYIWKNPEINIDAPDEIYYNCDNPDFDLNTILIPGDDDDFAYLWNTGEIQPNITIDLPGRYEVEVEDGNGCTSRDSMDVRYPIFSNFVYDAFCEIGDKVNYRNSSTSFYAVSLYEWDFGDGTTFIGEDPPPKSYAALGDYMTSLTVVDENGCEAKSTEMVFVTLIDSSRFDVTPNDASICVKDAVKGLGPEGPHVNRYEWVFGDGQTSEIMDPMISYKSRGKFEVSLTVHYNAIQSVTDGCSSFFYEKVEIFPELNASINTGRACKEEPIDFSFERTAGDLSVPIIDVVWDFGDGVGSSTDIRPQYTYGNSGNYTVSLAMEDALGCRRTRQRRYRIEQVSRPDFNFETNCGNEPVSFSLNFKDSLENITNYEWVFDNRDTLDGFWPPPPMTQSVLGRDTLHTVSLRVSNAFSKCDETITKTVKTLALPIVDYVKDSVCAGVPLLLRNTSRATTGTVLTGFRWFFHDEATSVEENPIRTYDSPGAYPLILVAENDLNCTDTLTQRIVVHEIPEAGIATADPFVEAFVPVQFFSTSLGDIRAYDWDFGDGTRSSEENPIHTYDSIKPYTVQLVVTNTLGCTDTLRQRFDLNVHLELPTAFSPNGDGENDRLVLIHNGIKELYEFKVFNRWGQLVFDGDRVNRQWDGYLNGQMQNTGVYVVHVKARGAYDTQFNFKRNVTLLR